VFIVVRNPLYRIIAALVSLAVIAIVYFAIVKPNENTANKAATQAAQQIQQAVSSAEKQSSSDQKAATQAVASAEKQATKVLKSVSKDGARPAGVTNLTSCLAAAGTDSQKVAACTAKFQP